MIKHLIVRAIANHGRANGGESELILIWAGGGNERVVVEIVGVEIERQCHRCVLGLRLERVSCIERVIVQCSVIVKIMRTENVGDWRHLR